MVRRMSLCAPTRRDIENLKAHLRDKDQFRIATLAATSHNESAPLETHRRKHLAITTHKRLNDEKVRL